MNDREENIDPDLIINQLLSRDLSAKHGAGPLNIKYIKERFLNALKEIAHLEKALEEKNTQLATSAKEKDRLIHALNKAFEEKKKLHDRLADFDVLRNMEIAEFKQSAEKIVTQLNRIHEEKYELLEDVFKKDRAIDDLKKTIKKKEFRIQELQTDLYTAIETLKGTESRYKDMEANYIIIEQERDSLKGKLSMTGYDSRQKSEVVDSTLRVEYQDKLEALDNEMRGLKTGLEKDLQLKDELINDLKGLYDTNLKTAALEIERLTSEKAATETDIKEIKEGLERYKKSLLVTNIEKETINELLKKAEEKINSLEDKNNEISLLNSLLDKMKKEQEGINDERINLEKNLQLKIQQIADMKNQYDSEIKRFEQLISESKEQRDKEVSEYQAAIKKLTAELDVLNLKLTTTDKEVILPEEERTEPSDNLPSATPFNDRRFLISDVRHPTSAGYRPSKIIYVEPSMFGWIKDSKKITMMLRKLIHSIGKHK